MIFPVLGYLSSGYLANFRVLTLHFESIIVLILKKRKLEKIKAKRPYVTSL